MQFKNEESDEFLKEHRGGENLLKNYLSNPRVDSNSAHIEVSSSKYPYVKNFLGCFLV
jgi:hypothetical protein